MLAVLRSSAAGPALRRIVALMLTLCTALAFLEPTIADSCDAQLESASVVASVPTGAITDSSGGSIPGTDIDGHLFHVCHCTHGHGAAKLSNEVSLAASAKFSESLIDWSERALVSADQDLKLRPPRA